MKIPKQAKLVFKGEIFDVYQWQQEMFDGSSATFEMIKRPDTVQILPVKDGKIFGTVEEQPGMPKSFGLFGGRIDALEEPLAAAQRELLEESGFEALDWELWKTYQPVVKMDWTIYYFIARNCRQAATPNLDNGEKIEIIKLSFDEFIERYTSKDAWDGEFTNDLLHMKLENKLGELKKKLF